MHVLGMPPAFVLSQDQTLRLTRPDGRARPAGEPPRRNAAANGPSTRIPSHTRLAQKPAPPRCRIGRFRPRPDRRTAVLPQVCAHDRRRRRRRRPRIPSRFTTMSNSNHRMRPAIPDRTGEAGLYAPPLTLSISFDPALRLPRDDRRGPAAAPSYPRLTAPNRPGIVWRP